MGKINYNLSYYNNGEYKIINLENEIEKENIHSLEAIDNFIMKFNNKEELLNYLVNKRLISNPSVDLAITSNKKNKETNKYEQTPIYNGKVFLYKNNLDKINIKYALNILEKNKHNGNFMKKLMRNYFDKYSTGNPKKILGILNVIYNTGVQIIQKGYNNLDNEEIIEYDNVLDEFIYITFYKYNLEFDRYLGELRIIRQKSNDGKYIKDYKGIRNFIINTNSFEKEITYISSSVKNEENEEYDPDKDGFLEREDWDRANKEILKDYKPDFSDDYPPGEKPLTKNELNNTYNSIATRALNKKPKQDKDRK